MNGGKAATFEIVHPAATGKPNTIVSPTSRVWALGRTLVDGPDDLDAAHKAHSEVKVTGPSVATEQQDPAAARGRATDGVWHDFFAEANRLLRQNRPPTADSAILARIAPLAIDPDDRFARDKFSSEQQSAIEAGIADARAFLTGARFLGNDIEGWSYPGPTLGNFGTDYIVRAITARVGLAALPREEAMYMQPKGDAGDGLYDGRKAWRLHFDAGKLPPVNAFWSLTMYERMPDGRSYFTENPTNRYSIGDRTAGLKMAADGSLNIWMGHDDPGPERRSNWLPAPAGPFNLWLRAYLPRPELLNGSYRLPRIGPA
jgi:hypothetical protein